MQLHSNAAVAQFLQKMVEKLTPAAVEAVQNKSTGHFEVHFVEGSFKLAKKHVTL